MGSIGISKTTSSMSINDFQIEEKKWDKRERANLERAIAFMSNEFGDIRDLIGAIRRRTSGTIHAGGLYDGDGFVKGDRATYFATDGYASESKIIHEFTHAVTEEIANHYKQLGYKSKAEVFNAMRTEVHQNLGKEERKYDGRLWRDRAQEYPSRMMESFSSEYSSDKHGPERDEVLKVVKKWFKKVGR